MTTAEKLVKVLTEKKMTCATAESCTGGLITAKLTAVPGASDVVLGGVVSYAESVKEAVLGVPRATIDTYGVVSCEVAKAMAEGSLRVCKSDIAVSVTGYAGPGGGDRFAEVGTVCIGWADEKESGAEKYYFYENGVISRDEVRALAAKTVLETAICRAEIIGG